MADNGRSYILDRMRSKRTTIEEFNYDALQAPPLAMFLSPFDIAELRGIATSLKLSGKPQVKFQMIDDICRRRGLVKFAAGTNRVIYRHPEFNNILFKIAYDDVGMGDNPAEFRNQFILKPFVAKTFEVSPCGTVAISERVKPFLNREEFISVADDVFELLNTWIIGKYIVADCGSRYFMNFGVRSGFGVVVLDYTYVYELDGNKLYCTAPDHNSPSGKCDGVIDYDDGFNFLHCTKCGARYRAKELAKEIYNNKIVLKKEGDIKMKISIKGGSNNVNKKFTDGVVVENNEALATIGDSLKVTTNKPVKKIPTPKENVNNKTVNGVTMHHKESGIVKAEPVEEKKVDKDEEVLVNVQAQVAKANEVNENQTSISEEVLEKAVKEEPKEVVQLVTFDENLKGKEEIDHSTPVFDIEKSMISILENIDKIKIDAVKLNTIENIISKVSNVSDTDKLSIFKLMIKIATSAINDIEDSELVMEALKDSTLLNDFISKYYVVKSDENETEDGVTIESYIGLEEDDTIRLNSSRKTIVIDKKNDTANVGDDHYNGIDWYAAEVINIKNLTPTVGDDYKALVIYDDNGNYITDNKGYIVAVDLIDNISIENSKLVSRTWFESLGDDIDVSGAEVEADESNDTEEEVVEDDENPTVYSTEDSDMKEAPVGSLPEENSEE